MKTAEQWVGEYGNLVSTGSTNFVRQIQADALRHAADGADRMIDVLGYGGLIGTKTGGGAVLAIQEIKRKLTEEAERLEE